MSAKIRINNWDPINLVESSQLDADASVGATALTVKTAQGFAVGNYIIIGRLSSESAELKAIGSVDAGLLSIGVTATKIPHNRFDSIGSLFGNKIRVYRAANVDGNLPADGSFSLLATIDIDPDQTYTDYSDAAGGSDYWYKATFYNSTASTETDIASALGVRGGGYGLYCTVDEVKTKAGLKNNRYIEDSLVYQKVQTAKAFIDSELTGLYIVPFTPPINPLIREIAILLAAGYLLTSEFGASSASTRAQGDEFITLGESKLTRINNKELKLTGVTGVVQTVPGAGVYNGWPNGDTATTADEYGGAPRQFRMNDRY